MVDTAYRFGSGTAVYADSPLQRRARDIHTLTQHFIVRPDTLTTAGAVLAGLEPRRPRLLGRRRVRRQDTTRWHR